MPERSRYWKVMWAFFWAELAASVELLERNTNANTTISATGTMRVMIQKRGFETLRPTSNQMTVRMLC